MMRNRNFQISDDAHMRLKLLAVRRGATIGATIAFLLDVFDEVEGPTATDAVYDAKRQLGELRARLHQKQITNL